MLASRVSGRCSNPACGVPTSGPHTNLDTALNLGVAAHIHGASEGGPRYDKFMSGEDRRSPKNGIWLCQTCAKLVDSDIDHFPAQALVDWKVQAETSALASILRRPPVSQTWHSQVPNISGETYHEARKLLIEACWQPFLVYPPHLHGLDRLSGNAKEFLELGYHELVSASGTGYAFCLFKFHDIYRNTLHVVTAGEEDSHLGYMAGIQSYWVEANEKR